MSMNAIATIETLTVTRAAEQNAEAVARAMRKLTTPCPCGYEQRREQFADMLLAYTQTKLKERRESHYSDATAYVTIGYRSALELRQDLEQIWPCKRCMARHNPTRRTHA